MGELVRAMKHGLTGSTGSGLSPRVSRDVARAVDLESGRGIVHAARVHAAAYVTHVGLTHVAALTAEEGRLIQQVPLGEERYRVIVDTFASVVANEVARMGYER